MQLDSRPLWAALTVLTLGSSSVFAAPTVRFKTLHEFQASEGVISTITAPLVKGTDGRLYGVAPQGGQHDKGTLFAISRTGDFSLLHSFTGLDGEQPNTLFRDPDGQIYGATILGGLNPNYGVLFSVGTDGTPTVVHNFSPATRGQINGSMVQFKQGSFYGTTDSLFGTMYRFTPPSTVETLYEFGYGADQTGPYFGLSKAGSKFYGTTYSDIGPGEFEVLHRFENYLKGGYVMTPLIEGRTGTFFGLTTTGPFDNTGTVFKFTVRETE